MADKREISDHYTELAREVIEEHEELFDLMLGDVTIVYLSSTHKKRSKGKIVLGQCEKVADKNKWAIPCDFTITLFDRNMEGASDECVKKVLFHELLHVGVDEDGFKYVRPHDLEDFKAVVDKYGVNWAQMF